MNNPKISIIVPVYNVESYINDCIESIINQVFKEFELILINDGSTDKSGEICDKYAENDNRIKVIHQINKGPGATRNLGIKLAKGEYIGFVDSDDTIDKEMYQEMYNLALKNKYDIVACGYKEIYYEKNIEDIFTNPLNGHYELIGENIKTNLEILLCKNQILGYASLCNKLYKKDIIIKNNIAIKENIKIAEDLCFNIQLLNVVKSIGSINKAFYKYRRINSKSLMNDKDNLYFKFDGHQEMLKVFKESNISKDIYLKCLKYESSSVVTSYIGLIKNIIKSKKDIYKKQKDIQKLINEEYFLNSIKYYDKKYLTFKVLSIVYIIEIYLKIKNKIYMKIK